jgi:hypothetical protein
MLLILIALLFVIGGVAGNLIAGWMQQDLMSNALSRSRIIASIVVASIVAVVATALGVYIQDHATSGSTLEESQLDIDTNQSANVQGNLQDNTIIQSGGGDVNISVFSEAQETSKSNSEHTPLLVSGSLIPVVGIKVWLSPERIRDEKLNYEELMEIPVYPEILAIYPQVFTAEMQVESLLESRSVRLSEFALVHLLDYKPAEIEQVYVGSTMGGWGYFHRFRIDLDPEKSGQTLQAEPLEYPLEEVGDFYVIDAGDVEVVSININFCQPGEYTFNVGVEYVFDGERRQQWAPETFTVHVPHTYYIWDWGAERYSITDYRHFYETMYNLPNTASTCR